MCLHHVLRNQGFTSRHTSIKGLHHVTRQSRVYITSTINHVFISRHSFSAWFCHTTGPPRVYIKSYVQHVFESHHVASHDYITRRHTSISWKRHDTRPRINPRQMSSPWLPPIWHHVTRLPHVFSPWRHTSRACLHHVTRPLRDYIINSTLHHTSM